MAFKTSNTSFAGPITFKNSKNAVEMINLVPNDRILIETDSPYLAPEPVRGTRNTPCSHDLPPGTAQPRPSLWARPWTCRNPSPA